MYKIFLYILILVIILVSGSIAFINPPMHKNVVIYNSDYEIVTVNTTTEKKVETTKPIQQTQIQNKTNVVKTEIKQTSQPIKKEITKTEKKTSTKTEKPTNVQQTTKKITPSKTQETIEIKKEPVVITTKIQEENEIIQWNIWRSNLQNQIMKDVKLPQIQNGIIFKFTFEVDKYGKITNIQTWSTTPMYTPYAIQYIAPVIKGYQGKSILNFPSGSNRYITTVEGGWKISPNVKYSTPDDFNDSEKIRK